MFVQEGLFISVCYSEVAGACEGVRMSSSHHILPLPMGFLTHEMHTKELRCKSQPRPLSKKGSQVNANVTSIVIII